jgi:hypothetical protein
LQVGAASDGATVPRTAALISVLIKIDNDRMVFKASERSEHTSGWAGAAQAVGPPRQIQARRGGAARG